jgi:glycerophosphoryl diester phosphodiesterase
VYAAMTVLLNTGASRLYPPGMVYGGGQRQAALVAALVLAAAATGCGDDTTNGEDGCSCPAASVINSGHRGTGTNSTGNPFPENTIESIEQAFAEGAEMSELDVLHSAEGVLVLMHDDTVDRTTDGTGCVGELTVSELQALDAAAGTSLEGTGVVIPTLAELLAAVDGDLNIELKQSENPSCPEADRPTLAADVVAAIHDDGKARRIVVSSFDAEILSVVKSLDDTIEAGLVTGSVADHAEATARGLDALSISTLVARADNIATIHEAGLDANVWTVNDETKMRELVDLGVDMVITDEPDLFAAIKSDLCANICP